MFGLESGVKIKLKSDYFRIEIGRYDTTCRHRNTLKSDYFRIEMEIQNFKKQYI